MRFRFIDPDGNEHPFVDVAALAEAVLAGKVHKNAMLYDVQVGRWMPARAHDVYQAIRVLPVAPSDPTDDDGNELITAEGTHPWRRYFARSIDGATFFLCVVIVLSTSGTQMQEGTLVAATIGARMLWIPFEALLLSFAGTTPGKWIMGIRVLARDGRRPQFSSAFARAAHVWCFGLGAGLPFVTVFTMLWQYRTLRKKGRVSWDEPFGLTLRILPMRPMPFATGALGILVLFLAGAVTMEMAPLASETSVATARRPAATPVIPSSYTPVPTSPGSRRDLTPPPLPAWNTRSNWRELREGMRQAPVRELLGEPTRIATYEYSGTTWYYGSYGGNVRFDRSGGVTGWSEP